MRLSRRRRVVIIAIAGLAIAGFFSWKPLLIRYRISKAKASLEKRNGHDALEWLLANTHLAPDHGETHYWLARAYRRLGRYEKVREHLEQAWNLGHPAEMVKREQLLAYAQSGQLKEAEPHLAKLLQDPQGDAREICEAYVAGYLLHHRVNRAIQILDAWQKDFPEDAYPHFIRGKIFEGGRNSKKAIESYQKTIDLDPSQTQARLRLAILLMGQHKYDEAGKHLERCLHDDPADPETLTGWSQWLIVKGRNTEAREALTHVFQTHPSHQAARTAMGELEFSAGNPEQAIRWLEPLAVEVPYDASVRYTLARALQRAGHIKQADEHFQFVDAVRTAMTKVQLLIEQIEKEPHNVEIRYEVGATLMKFGDSTQAAFWLRSVLEVDQQHRQAHEALAAHYEKRGPQDMAIHHRKLADELKKRAGNRPFLNSEK